MIVVKETYVRPSPGNTQWLMRNRAWRSAPSSGYGWGYMDARGSYYLCQLWLAYAARHGCYTGILSELNEVS